MLVLFIAMQLFPKLALQTNPIGLKGKTLGIHADNMFGKKEVTECMWP